MRYDYYCLNAECENIQEEEHSVNGFKEFKPECKECGGVTEYRWTPSVPQVAFLDGPTGAFPGKGNSFKNYRIKRNEEMKKRQFDRYGPPVEVIPNYQGKETGTWAEAQYQAQKEKGLEHGSTFVPRVKAERMKKGKIVT